MNDLKFSCRQLFKNPGFTAVAILTLALGIGSNTAIFSLVNGLLLHPPKVRQPAGLVALYAADSKRPDAYRGFSWAEFTDLRKQATAFTDLAAHEPTLVGLKSGEITRRVMALQVSASYLKLLGVTPARGRGFLPSEDSSPVPVVVVSDAFWRKTGADPDLVGKTLSLNATAFTVVGILPPGFGGTMSVVSLDLFTPLGMYDVLASEFADDREHGLADPRHHGLLLMGRLRPGLTLAAANTRLADVARRFAMGEPALRRDLALSAAPLPSITFSNGPQRGPDPLKILSALMQSMACVVLLLACLNLANLLLARGTGRRKEIAARLALGARRGRIVRQLVTEGLLLAVLGGAFGLLLARWETDLLFASLQRVAPMRTIPPVAFDARVFAATGGFCLLATILFALGPAWTLARVDVNLHLKDQTGAENCPTGRSWRAARNLFVPGQVALSLALLVVAGLFTRSAANALRCDPGFDLDSGFFLQLDAAMARHGEPQARRILNSVVERAGHLPGVESASLAATIPFGDLHLGRKVQRAGAPPPPTDATVTLEQGRALDAGANIVGAAYFHTLGVPLLAGREFTRAEAEATNSPPVVILSRRLAEQLWPGENSLGRRVQFTAPGDPQNSLATGAAETRRLVYEVVGVAPNLRRSLSADEEQAFVYLPFGRHFQKAAHLHIRPVSGADMIPLMADSRGLVQSVDPDLPVLALKSLRTHFEGSFYVWIVRVGAVLFGGFGAVALFLSVIGVYGVKAYAVARRTREIGIRIALGAERGTVVRMILREDAVLTAVGLGLGLMLALGAAAAISGFLFEVPRFDPGIFAIGLGLLTVAALVAGWLPARRAARVDPLVSLRSE